MSAPDLATVEDIIASLPEELRVSRQRVVAHARRDGIKPEGRLWPVAAVLESLAKARERDYKNQASPDSPRHKKWLLECELLSIRIAKERGKVVERIEAEAHINGVFDLIRTHIEQIPNRVAVVVRDARTDGMVREQIEACMAAMSDAVRRYQDEI